MRHLRQPGPVDPERIESCEGSCVALEITLEPGLTLNEALTRELVASGHVGGTLVFADAVLGPFTYVVPHPAPDASHVAYFSPPRTPHGGTLVEIANATFGWRDGAPFVHCHGVWTEADGSRRGGHMMPHETIIAEPGLARAWALPDVAIRVEPDPETNFSLFSPVALPARTHGRRAIVARVRPNEDLCTAVEAICRTHSFAAATIRGSLGSLIGATFDNGDTVPDIATEVLVLSGTVSPDAAGTPCARIDMAVVDMQGEVHQGTLVRGQNPVCITFELVLEEEARPMAGQRALLHDTRLTG
jgi:predicted DNA-binding protein with PD1-like motif